MRVSRDCLTAGLPAFGELKSIVTTFPSAAPWIASKALWPIESSPIVNVRISLPNSADGAAVNLPSEALETGDVKITVVKFFVVLVIKFAQRLRFVAL